MSKIHWKESPSPSNSQKKTSQQLGIVTTTNVCLLNNLSQGHQVMSTIALIRESVVSFHIIGNTP